MVRIGLFKRKKKEIRADTPAEMNVNTGQETSILTFFASTKKLTRSETLEIPTVAACISKLAGAVASLPVKLYRKEDGRITEITDDGRLKLLNGDTGDTLSTHDMWTAAIEDYFLGGGAWIYINSAGLKVRSLHYIDSRSVSILSNSDPVFKAFRVQINAREYYDFQFIKLLRKTHDGWTNIPLQEDNSAVLSAAYNAVRLENMMNSNGGCKPGFLKAQTKISKEVAEEIRKNYDLLYNNSSDRSERKLMVLNDGITFEPISSTAAELQLNENKQVNSMEVCKLFGFPHTIIDGGASEDDNRKFISAVTALVDQIETELDRCLLLESEKEQGYYWAFDTKELTRGSIRERFDAYEIAARNNIMQIDEIRREEDLEPLGFNFVKLGLSDVLLNPQTMEVFTPNTGQTKNLLTGEERARGDNYTKDKHGRFTGSTSSGGGSSGGSGGSSGGKAAGEVDKSGESDIIDNESDHKELKKAIADGKLSTKLDKKAQSAHKLGSAEYNKRLADGYLPSYTELSHMEVQKIINSYSLTGTVRKGKDGQFRETISVKENIGMFGNLKTGKYIPTNRATIHYSKKGAHLVPSAPLGGK